MSGGLEQRFGPTVTARFWAKVNTEGECWLWTGAVNRPGGYGQFCLDRQKRIPAHRYAYEQLIGPIPDGLTIDHLCRIRLCVRPEHLEPVTSRTNILRGNGVSARNAIKTHCPQGHPYSGDNLHVGPDNYRYCRMCKRDRKRSAPRRAAGPSARTLPRRPQQDAASAQVFLSTCPGRLPFVALMGGAA